MTISASILRRAGRFLLAPIFAGNEDCTGEAALRVGGLAAFAVTGLIPAAGELNELAGPLREVVSRHRL